MKTTTDEIAEAVKMYLNGREEAARVEVERKEAARARRGAARKTRLETARRIHEEIRIAEQRPRVPHEVCFHSEHPLLRERLDSELIRELLNHHAQWEAMAKRGFGRHRPNRGGVLLSGRL